MESHVLACDGFRRGVVALAGREHPLREILVVENRKE